MDERLWDPPQYEPKSGMQSYDMRMIGRIVRVQSTKQSVGIIIIENLGTERGLRQSHGLSFYIALTSKNIWL